MGVMLRFWITSFIVLVLTNKIMGTVFKKKLNILILEDDSEDYEFIQEALQNDGIVFTSLCVSNREDYCEALKKFNPDVVLSDHTLPKFNSIDALKICRADLKIPFILVTGTVSEEFAVNALKQGADDYILKSNLARLPAAIKNALNNRELYYRREQADQDVRRQNEELLKINREMDSLVYNVSHNIRSPLMSVLGLMDLIQKEGDDASIREHFLSLMRGSIKKLDESVREILNYSKNARSELNITKVDLHLLLTEYFDGLKFIPGASDIAQKVDVKKSVPFYSDSYRLNIIFGNLISNSVKYRDSTKRNPFINIDIEITNETALIIFSDNGIGIAPRLLDKVFNMFYRATEKSDGSGLGLYIVKEAVDKLKGTISVTSELGKGTTFRIELPNYR
ncbi:MAG: ATP-binding protein [Chryseolinea sp.]